ncbi:hypothetical protein NQ314_002108 [Rhamnusium bicolor]|uniref:DDE Tnp4 domain-containing protein n=1 Tax=Rhamnusium bicolor TaxID=1586634 RepID=A0AAV8ZQJ3_9CUCU|nr:hypothetical protein NQ314_002108 [Rhamnusium bicolor]
MGKKGINNIIGVIDGSHIEINKPKEDQDASINRKGYHSLLLQGIVDHEKRFTDVFCGEPGSMHDARLLRKSGIFKKMNDEPNFMGNCFLLGDSAYPNLSWLVTPFKDNPRITQNQKIFINRISATRVIVENAFGLLKGRFRRLKKLENFDLNLCSKVIMACCILHNICIDEEDLLDTDRNNFNEPDVTAINEISVGTNRRQLVFN